MSVWSFHSAGSLIFGSGSIKKLGTVCHEMGIRRALVITDKTLAHNGVLAQVKEVLETHNIEADIFDDCTPEPPSSIVELAAASARVANPHAIIGLGGGSNIDTAKLVSLLLAHGGKLDDYVGDCRVPGKIHPLICIPTTSGTGSDVSAAAVYTDSQKQMKVSCLSPFLRPAKAIVDPLLTIGCPAKVTADSGIDALTHAIEAYLAIEQSTFLERPPGGTSVYQGKNPMADMMASQCIKLVGQYLKRAVRDGSDLEAREGMALAGTLGGLAFSNAGVALVHAMEYPVGGRVHISHGAGNGLLLPYVMRFSMKERMSEIAHIGCWLENKSMHSQEEQMNQEMLAETAIQRIEDLRHDIGIPLKLRDIGVVNDMLPDFAEKAFQIKRLMRVNARMPVTANEILAIYQAAF